jgi:hypothetical protein
MTRTVKILDCKECDAALFRVDLGTAGIVKEYSGGNPRLYITSADGRTLGTPCKSHVQLFEQRLKARGNDDGLFPGCHQTTAKSPQTTSFSVSGWIKQIGYAAFCSRQEPASH